MSFVNAYINVYSPQQVKAVVNEAERLGYKVYNKFNYQHVSSVVFFDDATILLRPTPVTINSPAYKGFTEVKQTRHLRRVLCPPEVVFAPTDATVLADFEPAVYIKPSASKRIKAWLLSCVLSIKAVALSLFKHFK